RRARRWWWTRRWRRLRRRWTWRRSRPRGWRQLAQIQRRAHGRGHGYLQSREARGPEFRPEFSAVWRIAQRDQHRAGTGPRSRNGHTARSAHASLHLLISKQQKERDTPLRVSRFYLHTGNTFLDILHHGATRSMLKRAVVAGPFYLLFAVMLLAQGRGGG